MKVGFLGNMNNNHFAMARFLRDRGVDAEVLLFENEGAHFHPAADTYDRGYMEFCHTVAWGNPIRWSSASAAAIRADLGPYDVLVGCGYAPAFCSKAERQLDIFVPYGGDILTFTRYGLASPNRIIPLWKAATAQRRGIANSAIFQMDLTNPLYESLWQKLKGGSERWWFGLPMVHTGTYSPDQVSRVVDRTHWAAEFSAVRESSDLLLISHARHVWGGDDSDPNQKGTDRLLRGLALFRRRNPGVRTNLITLEYGENVYRSKQLIAELGIQDVVHWFPMMYRKDLMVGIAAADIVCAEFANSWLSSGVIYEALAMATPILGYRDDPLYTGRYPSLYPMLNARTPESICERLEEYVADRPRHSAMGREGKEWYQTFVVDTAVDRYLRYMEVRAERPHVVST